MTLDIYQIDAFSKGSFTGNPAAVCPLEDWIPEKMMQQIAMENNLSETAFVVKENGHYRIRWFTPVVEVSLCGHATLASAFVLFTELNHPGEAITFESKSGPLYVRKQGDLLQLDFPTDKLEKADIPELFRDALHVEIEECYRGLTDYLLVLRDEESVRDITPVYSVLTSVEARGVLVTAQAEGEFDFVSRGFFPQSGINEDPATGSAHTMLTPYWSRRLGKKKLKACQLSGRKGFFECQDLGDRTLIAGKANLYMKGKLYI